VITALTTQAGQVPEWVRLLPLGEVPLGDGREPLWVDQEALAAMVAHFQERGLDLVVDYEHQTLSGRKAPAAGWIRELEIRIAGETPAPQDGLWARVEWTATARQHLAAREYRYFSPVLRLEDKTRRPLALLHAALTNTPAINGLTPLVAKSMGRSDKQIPPYPPLEKGGMYGEGERSWQQAAFSSQKGDAFFEPEQQIPPNLSLDKGEMHGEGERSWQQSGNSSQQSAGMARSQTEVDFPPHPDPLHDWGRGKKMNQFHGPGDNSQRSVVCSQGGTGAEADLALFGQQRGGLEPLGDLAALLGLPEDAGASHIRGAVLALKGNLDHLQGVQEELTALKGELAARMVQEEVAAAIKAGKIQPCQKDSALRYARQDLEGFRSFVEKALPQIPLGRLNFGPDPNEERGSGEGLTSQQLLICQKLGLTPEAFTAQKTQLKQEKLL
jgi:phage I-like protein